MKTTVESADLKYYNANSRGNRSPDCVKRAISLAFDISYNETSKLLNQKMKELKAYAWNITPVFKSVIQDLGGGERDVIYGDETTVDAFADEHPEGIYILLTGKKDGGTTHLVTVRDGKVWDSWDSRNYYVHSYWTIDGTNRKAIRDTDKVYMEDIGHNFAIPVVHDEIIRYMTKKNWSYKDVTTTLVTSNYQILVKCKLELNADEQLLKNREYSFNVMLVIEPTWTEVEIVDFVQKTGKQRTYDRMWTINEQERKLREAAEIEAQLGHSEERTIWTTEQEDRFINTLPGWVHPLIADIQIQEPGKYIDSYRLKIRKLPNDTNHPDNSYFYFEGENASDIREMLREYKDNGRVEGIDYSWWDEH